MAYTYNNSVSLEDNILEIEVYGQINTESEEKEIRNHLTDKGMNKEVIEVLIVAYIRGFKQPK
jgi:hypothetical protein